MACLLTRFHRGLAWISSAAGLKSFVTPPGPVIRPPRSLPCCAPAESPARRRRA